MLHREYITCSVAFSHDFSVAEQYAGYQGDFVHAQTMFTRLSFLLPTQKPGKEVNIYLLQ